MKKITYYVVDVFAERPFEGNQLAVFRNAGGLSKSEMLNIAKEINYPEVSFIRSDKQNNNGFDVRIFTPTEEVPFAGHPSLGTAYIIQKEIIRKKVESVTLNLEAGKIPISLAYQADDADMLWMQQLNPAFSRVIEPAEIAEVLSIDVEDIDITYPIQEVSTGLPTVIVPLKNIHSMQKCKINRERYFEFVESIDAKLIHVFCPDPRTGDALKVRNFGDYYGVSEEPATGSSNGCLAGYLVQHNYFRKDNIDICVEQGYNNRPGYIYLQAAKRGQEEEEIEVFVGGKVFMMAKGEFLI